MRHRAFSLGKLTPASAGVFLCTGGCWRENVRVDSGLLPGRRPAARKNVRRAFAAGLAITRTIVRKITCQQLGLGVRDSGFGDRVLAFGLVTQGFPGRPASQQQFVRKKNGSPSIIGILHASNK